MRRFSFLRLILFPLFRQRKSRNGRRIAFRWGRAVLILAKNWIKKGAMQRNITKTGRFCYVLLVDVVCHKRYNAIIDNKGRNGMKKAILQF